MGIRQTLLYQYSAFKCHFCYRKLHKRPFSSKQVKNSPCFKEGGTDVALKFREINFGWRPISDQTVVDVTVYHTVYLVPVIYCVFNQEDFLNPDRKALGTIEADPADPLR
jgi:hypothetical protein